MAAEALVSHDHGSQDSAPDGQLQLIVKIILIVENF